VEWEYKFLRNLARLAVVVQFLSRVVGDADELGLLNLNFFKVILELIEFVAVVQPHGSAEHVFAHSAKESFVPYPDLEVDRGLVVSCMG
jgi:hypothetical protein